MYQPQKTPHKSLIFNCFLVLFLLSGCTSIKKTIHANIRADKLQNSFHGLVIIDANTQKEIYNQNGNKYFTPASNTKIVTFYTRLKLLPKNIPTLNYKVANDTIFIEGTGDPSWLHPYFKDSTAINWLKNQETIALYTQNHDERRYGPGWAWEDYDTYFSPEKLLEGIKLNVSKWLRPSPESAPTDSKAAGLYMICSLSKHEAEKLGFDDALMLDYRGYVAEATGANIFFVKDNELFTPIADCFLNGITRQTVVEIAKENKIKTHEKHFQLDFLKTCDEVFLTGTAVEITPVSCIENFNFEERKLTKFLISEFKKKVITL